MVLLKLMHRLHENEEHVLVFQGVCEFKSTGQSWQSVELGTAVQIGQNFDRI